MILNIEYRCDGLNCGKVEQTDLGTIPKGWKVVVRQHTWHYCSKECRESNKDSE